MRIRPILTGLAISLAVFAGCGDVADDTAGGTGGGSRVVPSGEVVATSGFDVDVNGFSFPNYGNENGVANLSPANVRALFGDQVCARVDGGNCVLTPTADKWMQTQNADMDGGHCFGLAGLSWAMYSGAIDAERYGAPAAADLALEGNTALQNDIAAVFVTQDTSPTTESKLTLAPNEAVATLQEAWSQGRGFALAIFNIKDGEATDGHAVTPVAVEQLDNGNTGIVLYDNNFPGEPQVMEVDPVANTWTYTTAADPSEEPDVYVGGADNPLELWPVEPMLGPQTCPFCPSNSTSSATGLDGATRTVTGQSTSTYVYLNEEKGSQGVDMTVTDLSGVPIPGATASTPIDGGDSGASSLQVPLGTPFIVRIDGASLTAEAKADLSVIGPGYSFGVDQFAVAPGEIDEVVFTPAANSFEFRTSTATTPDLFLTFENDTASYGFRFGGLALPTGGSITMTLDPAAQTVTTRTSPPAGAASDPNANSTVDFVIERIDDETENTVTSDPIDLAEGESLVVSYGAWTPADNSVPVGIDYNGDGVIDEQLVDAD